MITYKSASKLRKFESLNPTDDFILEDEANTAGITLYTKYTNFVISIHPTRGIMQLSHEMFRNRNVIKVRILAMNIELTDHEY